MESIVARRFLLASLGFMLAALCACQGQNFRGELTIQGARGIADINRAPVTIELAFQTLESSAVATITPLKNQLALQPWKIVKIHNKHYDLFIPDLRRRPFHLVKDDSQTDCFVSHNIYNLEFCHTDATFTLLLKEKSSDAIRLRLIGSIAGSPAEEGLDDTVQVSSEGYHRFTLQEAALHLLQQNFDVQEALQNQARAKEESRRNYRSLLPHLELKEIVDVGVTAGLGSTPKVHKLLGNVVPFLFPSRWIQAEESTWRAKAERLGKVIMQGNSLLALQSHTLFFRAHMALRDELKALQMRLEQSLTIAKKLRDDGHLDERSTLTLQIALNDLNIALREVICDFNHERFQISKLLGFQNPMAVTEVIPGEETMRAKDIARLPKENLNAEMEKHADLAIANSFELSQLHFLQQAANLNVKDTYINWFDVSGSDGIGLQIGPTIQIARSQMRSVGIRIKKTRATLRGKAYKHVLFRNVLAQNIEVYESSLEHRRKRLDLLLDEVSHYAEQVTTTGIKRHLVASDIRSAVKDTISGLESYYKSLASVEIEQAELDRMLLQGAYEVLLPHRSVPAAPAGLDSLGPRAE